MASQDVPPVASSANVDFLVDEKGSRIDVPPDSAIHATGDAEAAIGGTSPTNWWLYGLIGLGIVIALVLAMQMFSGAPGTDVQPGTPTAEPVAEQVTTQ
ncbi:hypothetical protein DevBK_11015 [Devosia sp. BK]|jgi:hypothetical protein|uniref:hypothetical protein n=1 Tax=unclassified Devosia TaxID=196773 RepID=UPI00071459A5|nr:MULTISPECIES: hypothetical protein [unclassified Devosia]KQN76901.1 hypothetical protein ASE94_18425 [Devosia sp. Leaf64]KQT49476.1 hypothetical protein ASG47_03880 [Devosia sp. Leaf420]MDV3251864.1 hypothetical protein [Devosia sp. BK]